MSSKPEVLIATTSDTIADELERQLDSQCVALGLTLKCGPDPSRRAFRSSEDLTAHLNDLGPAALFDTLLVLHAGTALNECFESRVPPSGRAHSPWHVSDKWQTGIAMDLMLRFPQLYSVFLTPLAPSEHEEARENFGSWCNQWAIDAGLEPGTAASWSRLHFATTTDEFAALHNLLRRFATGMRTIFDPCGFRTLVRNRFLAQVFGAETPTDGGWNNTEEARRLLNIRASQLAVLVDEERDLTLLTGYAAYKFGYRGWMINTYSEFLNEHEPRWASGKVFLLRDLDLRFPDIPPGSEGDAIREALKDIESKTWLHQLGHCDALTSRVISQDDRIIRGGRPWGMGYSTKEYRLGQRTINGTTEFLGLSKPLPSIYDVGNVLNSGDCYSLYSQLPRASGGSSSGGHGAPYTNLGIATDLIRNAEAYKDNDRVLVSVVSATLAQEAYALLLGMSRSTALEALRIVNLAEARLEAASIGVAHSLVIDDRRKDLQHLVETLELRDAGYNFLSQIWAELRLVYRDGEEFEASEQANFESLANTRWIFRRRRFGRRAMSVGLKRWLLLPARSFVALSCLFIGWAIILACLYCLDQTRLHHWVFAPNWAGAINFGDVLDRVMVSLCRAESLNTDGLPGFGTGSLLYRIANTSGAISSIVFIGFLASLLFRKVMRS